MWLSSRWLVVIACSPGYKACRSWTSATTSCVPWRDWSTCLPSHLSISVGMNCQGESQVTDFVTLSHILCHTDFGGCCGNKFFNAFQQLVKQMVRAAILRADHIMEIDFTVFSDGCRRILDNELKHNSYNSSYRKIRGNDLTPRALGYFQKLAILMCTCAARPCYC